MKNSHVAARGTTVWHRKGSPSGRWVAAHGNIVRFFSREGQAKKWVATMPNSEHWLVYQIL